MKRIYFAVIWPLIILVVVLLSAQIKSGSFGAGVHRYRLKIRGYDPKDLLQGRYLFFAVDWNFDAASPKTKGDNLYLCLRNEPASPYPTAAWLPQKNSSKIKCETQIRADSVMQLNRFYLPEDAAPIVEKIFREPNHLFEIEVNVNVEGDITAQSLLIDGEPWSVAVRK